MLTGAFAHGLYGIPRSTKDVDVVLSQAGEAVAAAGVLGNAAKVRDSTPGLFSGIFSP